VSLTFSVLRATKSWHPTKNEGSIPAVRTTLCLVLGVTLVGAGFPAFARSRRSHGKRHNSAEVVAVQPFGGGTNAAPLRSLVSRIVRGRGFRPITSLPHYEGTGQYPSLAREHHLTALVTGDVEERGKWSSVTFLVWNGSTGSVVGRWTASAPTPTLGAAVGKGFWQHLGPAVRRSESPYSPDRDRGPTMRIDASSSGTDEPIAVR
jgi:hypothetical protein